MLQRACLFSPSDSGDRKVIAAQRSGTILDRFAGLHMLSPAALICIKTSSFTRHAGLRSCENHVAGCPIVISFAWVFCA